MCRIGYFRIFWRVSKDLDCIEMKPFYILPNPLVSEVYRKTKISTQNVCAHAWKTLCKRLPAQVEYWKALRVCYVPEESWYDKPYRGEWGPLSRFISNSIKLFFNDLTEILLLLLEIKCNKVWLTSIKNLIFKRYIIVIWIFESAAFVTMYPISRVHCAIA